MTCIVATDIRELDDIKSTANEIVTDFSGLFKKMTSFSSHCSSVSVLGARNRGAVAIAIDIWGSILISFGRFAIDSRIYEEPMANVQTKL
jgi:hypothetical protein